QEDFDALLKEMLEEYSPETPDARNLVEDAALARWFLWCRQRAFNSVESALYAAQADPAAWSPEDFHKLALLDRYKTAAERSLTRVLQNLKGCRRAQKQQVQSKLAIARATADLEQHDREQWKKACQGFDRPTLVQKIIVRVRGGETVTRMSPGSNELLRELERTVYPPEQVHRYFEFHDGIPPEYYSFINCEDDRNEKEHTFEQTGPVAAWIATAAEEQKLGTGHALLGPSDFVS
ncbi:MAG TPA: hypothetical protein VH369_09955, partial [Bryobacteraceae bacterium]